MKNKIIVFGGTGNVGQIIVQKLLIKGENVTILTRTEKENKENLNYIVGNVLNLDTVQKLINKGDKVIIALGFNNSSLDTMSKGTENIIKAMKAKKADRLICLSSQGSGDSWDYMPEDFKKMVLADDILNSAFKDHSIQEEFVKKSDLSWTIVRPTEIIEDIEIGTYTINKPNKTSIFKISKYDVAQFIVNQLFLDDYLKKTVMITN